MCGNWFQENIVSPVSSFVDHAITGPVSSAWDRATTIPGMGGMAAQAAAQTQALNDQTQELRAQTQIAQNSATAALQAQTDAAKRATAAAIPVADSEAARVAAEAKMRKLLVAGSGFTAGARSFGAAPVGYRLLTGS